MHKRTLACVLGLWLASQASLPGATIQKRYYAHEAVEDANGVIAPWYRGQNGPCDFRARVAAETLKRYPWADARKAPAALPEFVYSGRWQIKPDGTITIPELKDWDNGDLGQRASYVLGGLVDYYRYTGDGAAIGLITCQADALLDYALTPKDHPWPEFPVTVPTKGKPYGVADPHGFIQLDIAAEIGIALVHAAQLTGHERYMAAARHWGDLLAEKRIREPGMNPWPRYANPEDVIWEDIATGGVAFVLEFFDALIRDGYTGKDNSIVQAREAGVAYLRDVLLPNWLGHDTWGRNYWDWPCDVQVENVTEFVARYLMEHPKEFPNWKNDARNIMTLFINRTCTAPDSRGDTYQGAWAYPESSTCCGRSLWYGPMELAFVYGMYGQLAGSEWGREMCRRQILLATYDGLETGVVEDNLDGGAIVAGDWFKIAQPMTLKHCLAAMAWMPDVLGASRENHIMRSSSVVTHVHDDGGRIFYSTHDAPPETVETLRLAYEPSTVEVDGADRKPLPLRQDLMENGYTIRRLPDGDFILTIRHDGFRSITLTGNDPQRGSRSDKATWDKSWMKMKLGATATDAGATVTMPFTGNQVRVIGSFEEDGGLAEVYLDDVKQLVGIDSWSPTALHRGVLYYRNGLPNGKHTLKIVLSGKGNPRSRGSRVTIDRFWASEAVPTTPGPNFGEGGGPTDAQRWLFGYPNRTDYVDSQGNAWRPATEFVVRSGSHVDPVAANWWTNRTRLLVAGTADPELYRYGVHAKEFWADFTVGPGTYHARLKFMESRNIDPKMRAITVHINGQEMVANLDVCATAAGDTPARRVAEMHAGLKPLAAGLVKPVDLVFNNLVPLNGVISIRLSNTLGGEAMVQAIEVGPGDGGPGARPVVVKLAATGKPAPPDGNLLSNGNFEQGVPGDLGSMGKAGGGSGWQYLFAGAGVAYVFPESAYAIHPEWGLPVFHGGKEAIRTHTQGRGHTIIWQDVEVKPDTKYTAAVWVRADDLHGQGFGADPCDSAGLWIQEFDEKGVLVVDHPKQAVAKQCDYTRLDLSFTTGKTTVRVRFLLDTVIAASYDQGHVTYDDCSLRI
ncbi:MAG TPA: malectin domain-containing carbohydrate-binding protein [Phycisphaerae bacterium]|nr:malectin domain-containing carbohydrate-binding protein [Phycisphaerae bacterium]HRY66559.1 malectin domain-containing carbohydrate-binding protein [Phycisphaerae bacterium]HSA26979.1 malectin domain-containing carbohydrate-binding protein [Phycisphaerae bacterium]